MVDYEREMTIEYLKGIQEKYVEGEGYERHPLPEWYALEKAIEALEQRDTLEKIRAEIETEINSSASMWEGHRFIGHTDQCIENVLYNAISQTKERVLDIIDKYREGGKIAMETNHNKGVLEKINEEQDSLIATCKAWDKAIEKDGYVN